MMHTGSNFVSAYAPLADRMRPTQFSEVVGQDHLVGSEGVLSKQIAGGHLPNCILHGPPGTGKTTIARLAARAADARFVEASAVTVGLPRVREIIAEAREFLQYQERPTVLFLDEIHRFNTAQQDALLPAVENGDLRLIGATTETPYRSVNSALLSRVTTHQVLPLTDEALMTLITRACTDRERGLAAQNPITISDTAVAAILDRAGSDARTALTLLEAAAGLVDPGEAITRQHVEQASDRRAVRYDRQGDQHYDYISALIKSMRNSDSDEALTWLASMVVGGEDPVFIARRLVIFASEDVGNVDPQALILATASLEAVARIGWPESRIILSQTVRYLAQAPKSRADYEAIGMAIDAINEHGAPVVPQNLRNRPL